MSGPPTSPVRALLARGSIYTMSFAIQLLSAAVSLPLATRVLSTQDYGVVALGYVLLGITTSAGTAGLHLVLGRSYFAEGEGPDAARRLITGAAVVSLGLGMVLAGSAPIWIGALGGVPHRFALVLAIATMIPNCVAATSATFFRAADQAARFVTIQLVAGVGGTFLGIAVVAVHRETGASGYWLGNLIAMTAAALLASAWIRPWKAGPIGAGELRSALRIGLPLVPQGVAGLVLALGDRLVIQARDGSASVGRYQVAYTMGSIALALVTALSMTLPPIIFGTDEQRRWPALASTLRAVRTLTAPLTAGLALGGPVLLRMFTPASYHSGGLPAVVSLVAASALPWAIYGFLTYPLLWHKHTKVIASTTVAAAGVNILLVYLLLPGFGLPGAASATLLAYWLLAWLLMRATRADVRVPATPSECRVWAVAAGMALIGAVAPVTGDWILARAALTVVSVGAALVLARRLVDSEAHEPVAPPAGAVPQRV
jgi:O-antigen/teichoic acid export membrane protein